MQLITKTVKGRKYWYAVKKGRRGRTVTNVKTIYLGNTDALLRRLGIDADEPGGTGDAPTPFPKGFSSEEVGASTSLWQIAEELQLPRVIDEICGDRRADAVVPFGKLLTILAIQRAIAPPNRKSLLRLPAWYESCRVSRLAKVQSSGLDERRVNEAIDQLDARRIEQLEDGIVARIIESEQLDLDALAFDATNFDSYASSTTPSRLLKRGHAKSKKANLRVLGLGLLVTADGGVPLLSFTYPGNKADVTQFKSFLCRLKRRVKSLAFDGRTTVVCDGGNISREVVDRLEQENFRFAARLPTGHAPEADGIPTKNLQSIRRAPGRGKMAAMSIQTEVYGKSRRVVAVFSESMKLSQIPGLERDIAKARKDLAALQCRLSRQADGKAARRHQLNISKTADRVKGCLTRQHMGALFAWQVGGSDTAPILTWSFNDSAWQDLLENRLGRTAVITDRSDWTTKQVIDALGEQSHAEEAFRQLKDRQWTSALPLQCCNDRHLRVRSFVAVLGLLLGTVLRRRLAKKGISLSTDEMLAELSALRYGYLRFATGDPAELHAIARSRHVPPCPTQLQRRVVRALNVDIELGPTMRRH